MTSRSRQPSCVALGRQGNRSTDDQMIDSTDLISRFEAAEGGSRELDTLLAIEVGHRPFHAAELREGFRYDLRPDDTNERIVQWVVGDGYERRDNSWKAPPYTTSLDAIVALIERELPGPGPYWEVRRLLPSERVPGALGPFWAAVGRPGEREGTDAATAALALCIAFLKAKALAPSTIEGRDR